ncbi:MAG TPA: hypothetical protein VGF43_18765 [Dongiaceae bacterium]|jgi:hypothetical protein
MGLMRWLGYQTDELVSPLSIIECTDRLRSATQSEWAIFGTRPVVGKVGEKSFRLRKRLKMSRNSFQTYLSAKLSSEGMSTRLTCRFGMHPFVVVFMIVWFGGVTAGAIGSLVFGLRHYSSGTMPSAGPLVPWGMVVFGIALVGVGRAMARGERQFLLDFLRETVDARPDISRAMTRVVSVVRR